MRGRCRRRFLPVVPGTKGQRLNRHVWSVTGPALSYNDGARLKLRRCHLTLRCGAACGAGRRVTGPGCEVAADTGVTEPKGHEESHGDGENTSWVTEDNQGRGQLPRVALASLLCSLATSLYFSLPHLGLPPSTPAPFVFSPFLSSPLSLLLALLLRWLQAMLSVPLSHPVMEGWPAE